MEGRLAIGVRIGQQNGLSKNAPLINFGGAFFKAENKMPNIKKLYGIKGSYFAQPCEVTFVKHGMANVVVDGKKAFSVPLVEVEAWDDDKTLATHKKDERMYKVSMAVMILLFFFLQEMRERYPLDYFVKRNKVETFQKSE